jgi:hypothetical protein
MRSPVLALSWELVARFRWRFFLAGAWLVLLCSLGLLLPKSARFPEVGVCLAMTLSLAQVFVLGALMHGYDTPLEERRSGFPARLFTLPAPVIVLAGPPLVLGTTLVFICWVPCYLCLLRGFGIDAPSFWPPLCIAAVVAVLQAMAWSPFPLPWLRLAAITIALGVFLYGPLFLVAAETSETVLALLFLALLVLGYAGALVGVARGRRGVGIREPVRIGAVAVSAERATLPRPFSSPLRAQLWLEWRTYGWVFLFFGVLCLGVILPSMSMLDFALKHDLPTMVGWLPDVRAAVGDSWLVMSYLLFVPFMLSLVSCGEMGRTRGQRGIHVIPPFLATRPMSTPDMVKAKLLACAIGVCCTWGMVLLGAVGWAIFMGRLPEMTERLVALTGSGAAAFAVVVAGLLLLMAITWLWMVQGMWVGLLGRLSLMTASICSGLVFWLALVLLAINWREEWRPILSWSVAAGLVVKVLALCWVVRQLRRGRLLEARALVQVIAVWVVFAAVVVSLAVWLVPGGLLVAGVTLLLLPLARCLAAPLALACNRSR